jgi:hypothetical protein
MPGTNPQADLTTWFATINAGEPYDTNAEDQMIAQTIARYHSAYYLLDGAYGAAQEAPAPLLISNGFTDDLFPVDEAVRYYNLEQSLYPSDPVALFDFDGGHMRGQNKPADTTLLASRIQSFLGHYVGGAGPVPQLGATALTETCPSSAPSGGPFSAPTWAALHPGEVDFAGPAPQTVSSAAGDPTIAKAIDPISGTGACATVSSNDQGSGVATYRLPAATGNGYTLLGAATVVADLEASGGFPQLAARLWDVDQSAHTQTLVARGIYRLDPNKPDGLQVFQLHPGAWHFAAGHIPKLELLGQDAPYARPSNGPFTITVSDLQLRLPVHDQPGASGVPAVVTKPQSPVTPQPHACIAYPVSDASMGGVGSHPTTLYVGGTASETPCPNASAATRRLERVVRVFVTIWRPAAHNRCRFLQANSKLTTARSCKRAIALKARGTKHWTLRVRRVSNGRYIVQPVAVDGLHHREQHPTTSSISIHAG